MTEQTLLDEAHSVVAVGAAPQATNEPTAFEQSFRLCIRDVANGDDPEKVANHLLALIAEQYPGPVVVTPPRTEPRACCDSHGRNCEPPSELCCNECTEFHHGWHADPPNFDRSLSSHHDGSACSNPDLSGFGPAVSPPTTEPTGADNATH